MQYTYLRYHAHKRRKDLFWIKVAYFFGGLLVGAYMFAARPAGAAEPEEATTAPADVVITNIVGVDVAGQAVTTRRIHRYDFSHSRFPIEEDPQCTEECRDPEIVSGIAKYITGFNKNADGIGIATWLTEGKAIYGPDVPLEAAAAILVRESRGNPKAHNRSTNCIGYFQWMHRYHAAPMQKIGLNIYDPHDNIDYFFIHVQADLDRGMTLDQALRLWEVWTVRKYKARAEYFRLLDEGWPTS